ncbi:hypothetical protein E4U55_002804 [Claviceps digitariae]|nr:hypothetical protein E4U55_002804 [Claviceps digitariae]
MMPPFAFPVSFTRAPSFNNTEVTSNHGQEDVFSRSQGLGKFLQRICKDVRRRLCLSNKKPQGRIVWFDRHMPWMDSPARAQAEMERLGHMSNDNNKRRPRGLSRIFRRDHESSRRNIIIVSPYDQIFLTAPSAEESRRIIHVRRSPSELMSGSVRARRPAPIADEHDEAEVDSDDLSWESFPRPEHRVPTLPVLNGPLENPNPPVILHDRIPAGPSVSARESLYFSSPQRMPSHNFRVRTCHVTSDNVIANRVFGPPSRDNAPPRYYDDLSPPEYLRTALPDSPLYRFHDGRLLDLHHAALRADGFIRYYGDEANRIPRLGQRGRLYLELQHENYARDGVPIDIIFEQHQGEGLPLSQQFCFH